MIYYSSGTKPVDFSIVQLQQILQEILARLGTKEKILLLPPDFTRYHSLAGQITSELYTLCGEKITAILPATGTHRPMTEQEIARMFPGVPTRLFKTHNWRTGTRQAGVMPAEYLRDISEGAVNYDWPVEVSRELFNPEYDLILSIGQVVPHEVIGMANYTKNILVGTGGAEGINKSHFLGAAYGIERILGQVESPVRKLLNQAAERYLKPLPIVYILTVIIRDELGTNRLRGLFIGDDDECYFQAAALSRQLNICHLTKPIRKAVVYLDPGEYKSTWLGNKAVYRTRLAMADGGELIVLAPGVREFGEDEEIDRLIRKYGYTGTARITDLVKKEAELQHNLGAAAHLMHGSTEDRFTVTYCPGGLSRTEIEQVNYRYGDPAVIHRQYYTSRLYDGWNLLPNDEEIYYISNPASGLWEYKK